MDWLAGQSSGLSPTLDSAFVRQGTAIGGQRSIPTGEAPSRVSRCRYLGRIRSFRFGGGGSPVLPRSAEPSPRGWPGFGATRDSGRCDALGLPSFVGSAGSQVGDQPSSRCTPDGLVRKSGRQVLARRTKE